MIELADVIKEAELAKVRAAYAVRGRHYHTWSHIETLLNAAKRDDMMSVPIVLAIVYHDVVYDASAKDNEAKSAKRLAEALQKKQIKATASDVAAAQNMITLGTGDAVSDWFWDADREILAAAPDVYVDYAADVRKESGMFPDFMYKRARAAFLKSELARPFIYRTAMYRERFEAGARANIQLELSRL